MGIPQPGTPVDEASRLLSVSSLYHNQNAALNQPPVYQTERVDVYRHLLASTQVQPNGMAWFNEQDMAVLLNAPYETLTLIRNHWPQLRKQAQQGNVLPAVTTIFLAERIAEDGTTIDTLYPLFSQLDTHPNPLVPIYLAGAYAEMHRPEPFGWAIMQMMQLSISNLVSQNSDAIQSPHYLKRHEEVGKLLVKQLKQWPQLWQNLQPFISTQTPLGLLA